MTTSSKQPLFTAALVIAAALGAFTVGRLTSPPAGTPPVEPEHGHAAGHEEEPEGVVRMDAAARRLAHITLEPVSVRSVAAPLALTGTVEPTQTGLAQVTPRVSGKITAVHVGQGDTVRAGLTLALLSSTELSTVQAQYRQAQTRVELAAAHLARQHRLAQLGEFGRHKVEEARQREIEAHGEINQALAELTVVRNEAAEARSEQAALEGEVARAENEVASAESEIIEAQGQVRALQAALAQTMAGVKVAESKLNRYERLIKVELVSRQDLEQVQADLQQARSNADAARANISKGQAEVETARAHKAAAQAQVRAANGRVRQAADKIETLLSRQQQVDERLQTARKRDTLAEQALAREERVYQGGFLTRKEIEEARAALRLARSDQQAAAETVRLLGGTPGSGGTIAVTAPIDGRITERRVTLGETVDPTKALFTVANLTSVWVQLSVPQRELARVRNGQPVTVTSDAAPGRTFAGVVSYIGDRVDETTRTVSVRAVIRNAGGILKPQSFVRGTVATGGRLEALAVPREAVQTLEGKQVVFVQGDHADELEVREVETGETVGDLLVIRSGLEPGTRIVTRGAFTVKAQAMKAELGHEH
jgi:cobalt-zinc-cadmium efflux system membrane fusion protein